MCTGLIMPALCGKGTPTERAKQKLSFSYFSGRGYGARAVKAAGPLPFYSPGLQDAGQPAWAKVGEICLARRAWQAKTRAYPLGFRAAFAVKENSARCFGALTQEAIAP